MISSHEGQGIPWSGLVDRCGDNILAPEREDPAVRGTEELVERQGDLNELELDGL